MFVVFYVSVVALVIARVLPVASLLVVLVVPDAAPHVWRRTREPKPAESPIPNPVWPLWFAAHVVPRHPPGRWPARARADRRRDPRLVNARRRASTGAATSTLALALLGAFCFGCTILFSRTVARDGAAAERRARHPLRRRRAAAARRARGACAGRCSRRRVSASPRSRSASCVYAVESTFFYLGLERGTAAAVALIFYAYPAVVALVEVALGAIRLRARTRRRARCSRCRAARSSRSAAGEVAITADGRAVRAAGRS